MCHPRSDIEQSGFSSRADIRGRKEGEKFQKVRPHRGGAVKQERKNLREDDCWRKRKRLIDWVGGAGLVNLIIW